MMTKRNQYVGLATIALATGFNLPYAYLAAIYDYPDILRQPASDILERFAQGGPTLVVTWYAFGLVALLFIPVSLALSLTSDNRQTSVALSISAAVAGALSGLTQAMGLWRWVFVVPELARQHAATDAVQRRGVELAFETIHAYGGVAIGEHLGQWLLVMFVCCVSLMQRRQGRNLTSGLGMVVAVAIAIGTMEGLALALDTEVAAFSIATISGFLALTLWLCVCGFHELRGQPLVITAAAKPTIDHPSQISFANM